MRSFLPAFVFFLLFSFTANAQLVITDPINAQALAQRLVGEGVTISNVTVKGDPVMAAFFKNNGGNNIGIDSGIVLTNGFSRSNRATGDIGIDGNGIDAAVNIDAHNELFIDGDDDLANSIGVQPFLTFDAYVLEFDFVPSGDSIKFRYVFSSEEYPDYACSGNINDAFAFFISGPGFAGNTNIALVPGTNDPVTIRNINGSGCAAYPQYFINSESNTTLTHNGHTTVFTALAKVQPCETFHLKLVIADVGDGDFDSGVFLEAKSLTSNAVELINNMQTSVNGIDYLVEGCVPGSFTIRRPKGEPTPLDVTLQYGGTAINGVDVIMPTVVTIPANETEVEVNIIPLVDNLPEGIETIKVYSLAGCAAVVPIDSTEFEIRDYDTLGILPAFDTMNICRNSSVQLQASGSYTDYSWSPSAGLNNDNIANPVATPPGEFATYIATATIGSCNARDSISFQWKIPELVSTTNVNCAGGSTGQITVGGGTEWAAPLEFSLDGINWQSSGTFTGLAVDDHVVKFRDATGCIDSITVSVLQAFPDLFVNTITTQPGSCLGGENGSITAAGVGGNGTYEYSLDGITWQSSPTILAAPGIHTIYVRDGNGCISNLPGVEVTFVNTVTLSTGDAPTICEGLGTTLPATTNAQSVVWSPDATLDNATLLNPIASPSETTKYYITATTGICERLDSVIVNVLPAPIPNAGADESICFGGSTALSGSGGVEFRWTPTTYLSDANISAPLVERPLTTAYYLSVTDANGCQSLKEDTVIITVAPPAKLFIGRDTMVAMNQPIQLSAVDVNNTGFVNYTWDPATGLNNAFIQNPIAILNAEETRYIVTAVTDEGCAGVDTMFVKTYKGPDIYVPTAFTPNGDGINDLLKPIPIGIKELKHFTLFNRFGQRLFTTNDAQRGWDGKIKGIRQNTGSFVWFAEGIDYRGNVVQRKGVVTLVQ